MIRHQLRRVLFVVALLSSGYAALGLARADEAGIVDNDQVVGRIRRNSSAQGNDAPYVVLDRMGVIQSYLRPGNDVDLDRFVDQTVRVSGRTAPVGGEGRSVLEVRDIAPVGAPRGRRGPAMPPRASAPERAVVRPVAYDEPPMLPVPDEGFREEPVAPRAGSRYNPGPNNSMQSQGAAPPSAAMQGQGAHSPNDGHDHGQGHGWENQPGDDLSWDGYEGEAPCEGCNRPTCATCCGNFCGPPGLTWVRAEYLYWWSEGMKIPPLVTTGPSVDQPGYLGSPGTIILFGDSRINSFGRSGIRLTAGTWLNACQTIGIEGDYFGLETATTNYSATSGGSPILSRPFYDLSPTQADPSQIVGPNVENVAAPDIISGTVSVSAQTRLQSAGLRMLINLCCSQQCYDYDCMPSLNGPGGRRLDFLIGYRYARLSDSLSINENLTSLESTAPGMFLVNDSFQTQNVFNGLELGTVMQHYRGRWNLELTTKMALGNSRQSVTINGSTVTTQNGVSTTDVGGLLAQSTNIGQYARNQFAVMPELGLNLGYQITPRLRILAGYTFLYWSRVVRAGDQIDMNVNSRLLPNDTRPLAGDTRHPMFAYQDADFWAQGINAGLDYRW